jgi:hypothetical protein
MHRQLQGRLQKQAALLVAVQQPAHRMAERRRRSRIDHANEPLLNSN